MNRRRFLSFLGLAPVAAALPAMALPRPDKPTDIEKLVIDVQPTENTKRWLEDIGNATGPSSACATAVFRLYDDGKTVVEWRDGKMFMDVVKV